jgi:hypothetical protein
MGIYYIACVLLSVFNFLVKNPFAHELKKKKKEKTRQEERSTNWGIIQQKSSSIVKTDSNMLFGYIFFVKFIKNKGH